MRVLVWGLGYVGAVTAACLAQAGHTIVGIDPDETKVRAIEAGCSPLPEPGLESLIQDTITSGRLTVQTDGARLVHAADLSLICVGTPSTQEGRTDPGDLERAAATIGDGLKDAETFHTVVLRSTVVPGVTRHRLLPILERRSGRRSGRDFGVAANPEFLREGSALTDFRTPPYTIIGSTDERSAAGVEALYQGIGTTVYHVSIEEAELLKIVNNAFHGLKIGFANEISRLCEPLGLDSDAVMRLVCADTKLNISPAYLQPGFAFGGSCLPKDIRALNYQAKQLGVDLPILSAILPSNALHLGSALRRVRELNVRSVGILGFSYKPGTGDLRESPALELVCALHTEGYALGIFDPDLRWEALPEGVRVSLESRLPGIQQMLCSEITEVWARSQAVVVCQKRPEFQSALCAHAVNATHRILDLTT